MNLRKLKPGQMPKAAEWNALIDGYAAAIPQPSAGGYSSKDGFAARKNLQKARDRTLFKAEETIPPYSVFAVKPLSETSENAKTINPFLLACKYKKDEKNEYIQGYTGCSSASEIPAGALFFGEIIDDQKNFIVTIEGGDPENYPENCSFSDDSFSAEFADGGLVVLGKYDESQNLYVVRRFGTPQEAAKEAVICEVVNTENGGVYSVKLYENGPNEKAAREGYLHVLGLALNSNLPIGTKVLAHYESLQILNVDDYEKAF